METKMTTTAPEIPRRFTRSRAVRYWGKDYTITPAVARGFLGDGRQLLRFQPLNARPNYYLIRIDSSWIVDRSDKWIGHLEDEIIDALIEEFSEKECERENLAEVLRESGIEPNGYNTDLSGNEERLGFPVLSLDSGYGWNSIAIFDGRRRWIEAG